MELIKITTQNGEQVCSARELHEYLEVSTDFSDWCKRMFDYGFEEGKDFTSILGKSTGGRPSTDYALKMDCAKEIAMLQRTEKGKQARLYFIAMEKKAKQPINPAEISKTALAQMVIESEAVIEQLKLESKANLPKVIFADAVSASKTTILIGELAKILKQNGMEIGQNRLFEKLREEGYLIRRQGTDFNMPTQLSMEMELFEIKETVIAHSDGHTSINKFSLKVAV